MLVLTDCVYINRDDRKMRENLEFSLIRTSDGVSPPSSDRWKITLIFRMNEISGVYIYQAMEFHVKIEMI